ncbi:methyl-accepting chemotaxis protein [Azospira sp. I13]|uniref:methyl-accepting chemotaxis protein n=1 Tax=Azospira sp. I13 TaxID=1765050 RepID=UPI000D441C25|nr:methyl-accepting chemotaxis protein [Azospira sp. I13]GBG01266.1 methyl-accepting chemotaxis protein [Azospira sp. I13]
MNWFDHLSLRAKLYVNFAVTGGILVLALVFCILQIQKVGGETEEIITNWLPSLQLVGKVSQERLRYRVRSLEYMMPGSPEEKVKIEKSLAKLDEDVRAVIKEYQPMVTGPQEQAILDGVAKAVDGYKTTVEEAIALSKAGKEEEAQQLRRKNWVEKANQLRDRTDDLAKFNREGADKVAQRASGDVKSAISGGLMALVAGVVVALVVSFLLAQRMARRLDEALEVARRIASGDLTGNLPPSTGDEVGRLVAAMGEMQQALRSTIGQTKEGAAEISTAAQQLAGTVRQMEQSVTIQSSASSAIAANIEELTVSINHVSDNTGDAARLAAESDEQARAGRETVDRLVGEINQVSDVVKVAAQQIGNLEEESQKISNIVSVIKDIADQTNLLALNAAIEAARAGEHGRGFAVVADEVRKLSERTAQSTGEITQMVGSIQESTRQVVAGIGGGVGAVESSVDHARQAGATIAQLQDMARRVAEIIGDVDVALREQSSASTEVARKVEEIATHAEETNAAANETSRAADTLDRVAGEMQEAVSRFRV